MSARLAVGLAIAAAAQMLFAPVARADAPFQLAQAQWPPPGMPPPPPSVNPVDPPTVVPGPRVVLKVDNPNARLQQATQLRWRDICIAPCGVTVDSAALYRIGGGTARTSEPFNLPRSSGDVYIDAQVGSKITHWVGLGLMIGGVVAAGYGFFAWQLFSSFASNDNTSAAEDARSFGRTLGLVFISVGAVLEAVGLPMFFSGTSVQIR